MVKIIPKDQVREVKEGAKKFLLDGKELSPAQRVTILKDQIADMDREKLEKSHLITILEEDPFLDRCQDWFDALSSDEQTEWKENFAMSKLQKKGGTSDKS